MRVASKIVLTDDERTTLKRWSRGRRTPARVVLRAKIVLLAADDMQNRVIGKRLGADQQTVTRWRNRFAVHRLGGIERDAPRGGRKPTKRLSIAHLIVSRTTTGTPDNATQWSVRTLAKELGTTPSMVHRVWQANGLKPHMVHTFKVSNDPHFAEKLVDIVGLYMNPPEHALVLCVDEKTQIQALDRTQPGLPLKRGRCGTMTHDYKRNGTTSLFAALEVAEGKVIGKCMQRHRHQEWLKFLKVIDHETPAELDLHLIIDNYSTHKHAKVMRWIERHPRFYLHFTPTSSSWLNLVERWFRELTCKRIRRGVFHSVPELEQAIDAYIANHNQESKALVWTAKADLTIGLTHHK